VPVEGSVPQLLPAPRLSRTPGGLRPTYAYPGCDTESVLAEFGLTADDITNLESSGVIRW
jgi:crotonobetainyl-CoA:carnitine CoA-transferase CaiB-like acyl-CoA transferase